MQLSLDLSPLFPRCHGTKQCSGLSMASCTDRSGGREAGSRKKATAREREKTSGTDNKLPETHYINPFLLARNDLVSIGRNRSGAWRCNTVPCWAHALMQPIGGATSGWRHNARTLRDDGNRFMPFPVPCCFPSSGRLRLPVFAPLPPLGFALPAAELDAPCCFPPLWFCLSRTIFFLLSSAGALHSAISLPLV